MVVPARVKRREGKINDRVKAEDQGCVMWACTVGTAEEDIAGN